jgi:hypothetical protein
VSLYDIGWIIDDVVENIDQCRVRYLVLAAVTGEILVDAVPSFLDLLVIKAPCFPSVPASWVMDFPVPEPLVVLSSFPCTGCAGITEPVPLPESPVSDLPCARAGPRTSARTGVMSWNELMRTDRSLVRGTLKAASFL